jgi:vacuolar-type H+-ATPase subunit F/Vma7
MLLAGIGHITSSNATADLSLSSSNPTVAVADLNPTADARTGAGANGSTKNFLIVDSKTSLADIENAFEEFTAVRRDIGIVLINQHVCSPSSFFYGSRV